MGFEVVPAIDLRAGRVVRLLEGDFARETGTGPTPSVWPIASRWPAPDGCISSTWTALEARRARQTLSRPSSGTRRATSLPGGWRYAHRGGRRRDTRRWCGQGRPRAPPPCGILSSSGGWWPAHGVEQIAAALDVRAAGRWGRAGPTRPTGDRSRGARRARRRRGRSLHRDLDRPGRRTRGPRSRAPRQRRGRRRMRVTASGGIASIADLRAVRGDRLRGGHRRGPSTKDARSRGGAGGLADG